MVSSNFTTVKTNENNWSDILHIFNKPLQKITLYISVCSFWHNLCSIPFKIKTQLDISIRKEEIFKNEKHDPQKVLFLREISEKYER